MEKCRNKACGSLKIVRIEEGRGLNLYIQTDQGNWIAHDGHEKPPERVQLLCNDCGSTYTKKFGDVLGDVLVDGEEGEGEKKLVEYEWLNK